MTATFGQVRVLSEANYCDGHGHGSTLEVLNNATLTDTGDMYVVATSSDNGRSGTLYGYAQVYQHGGTVTVGGNLRMADNINAPSGGNGGGSPVINVKASYNLWSGGTNNILNVGGRILGGTPDTMPLRGVINKKPDGSPDPGNLTHTHPISLVYDSDLALTRDKGVYDPAVTSVLKPDAGAWWGQGSSPDLTIKNFLLNGGNHLECTSCHDVHNAKGSQFDATLNPNLLILAGSRNGQGSLLCRSCHNK